MGGHAVNFVDVQTSTLRASIIPMSNASYASDHIEEEEKEEDDDDDEEPSSKSDNCYDYNCEYDDATSNNGGDGDDYYDDDEGDNDKSSVAGSLKSPQQEGASMKGNRSSSASRPGFIIINLPPPSPPPDGLKNTAAAATLPCSAASSPMPEMVMMNGSSKHGSRGLKLHPLIKSLLHRQHSKAVTRATSKKDASFPRSKSCGDGRSSEPPDNFDMCSRCYVPHDSSKKANVGSEEDGQLQTGKKSFHGSDLNLKCFNGKTTRDDKKLAKEIGSRKFKCRAFCMFLPGISKGKHASTTRRIKEKREEDYEFAAVSRIVSLEKFECGSFASSVRQKIEEEEEKEEQEQDRIDSYYDLPLEMITEEEKDTNSPVQAKFVFQKDRKGLKRSESKLTSKSSRHVRFLASTQATRPFSPSKVGLSDDQLKKAREDLNGYLEAMV